MCCSMPSWATSACSQCHQYIPDMHYSPSRFREYFWANFRCSYYWELMGKSKGGGTVPPPLLLPIEILSPLRYVHLLLFLFTAPLGYVGATGAFDFLGAVCALGAPHDRHNAAALRAGHRHRLVPE
jgi:hypothetical protein